MFIFGHCSICFCMLPVVGQFSPLRHSHSIVPGGLLVMSYVTRFTLRTLLQIAVLTCARNFASNGYTSAVIPSEEHTARRQTTRECVRWSPCTPTLRTGSNTANACTQRGTQ